jgi:hypothetical protein
MNDQMRDSEMVNLERSLRALAEEDCRLRAPSHVRAAVMHTWDVVRPFVPSQRRRRRRSVALLAIGSMAAGVVIIVMMSRAPSERSRFEPVVARAAEERRVVANVPSADRDRPVEVWKAEPLAQRRPRRPPPRGATTALRYEPGIVLISDPILDASAMSIVRVRVPRTALVPLGLQVVEPDDNGAVDLEMLVGEDGVARTIRRAVPVAIRQE